MYMYTKGLPGYNSPLVWYTAELNLSLTTLKSYFNGELSFKNHNGKRATRNLEK